MTSPLLQRWRVRLRDRRLHEFLWYGVPGVLVYFFAFADGVARMVAVARLPRPALATP